MVDQHALAVGRGAAGQRSEPLVGATPHHRAARGVGLGPGAPGAHLGRPRRQLDRAAVEHSTVAVSVTVAASAGTSTTESNRVVNASLAVPQLRDRGQSGIGPTGPPSRYSSTRRDLVAAVRTTPSTR